jgi:hypothetical protein
MLLLIKRFSYQVDFQNNYLKLSLNNFQHDVEVGEGIITVCSIHNLRLNIKI